MATRAFIMGSCVSRDAISLLMPPLEVAGYVARQSIISSGAPAGTHLLDASRIASPFQLRNLLGDLRGDLALELEREAPAVDVVLWDIVDERSGVRVTPQGYFTDNYELHLNEAVAGLDALPHIPFGSDAHFELWCASAERITRHLGRLSLRDRTLVVAPDMATSVEDGTPVGELNPRYGADYGQQFRRYVDFLVEDLGLPAVRPDGSNVQAGREHRWGIAPFHYARATEQALAEEILGFVQQHAWEGSPLRAAWILEPPQAPFVFDMRAALWRSVGDKDFLVEAVATDADGQTVGGSFLDWPHSSVIKATYRYIGSGEGGGHVSLGTSTLAADGVSKLAFFGRNWADQRRSVTGAIRALEIRPHGEDAWTSLPRGREA